LTLSLYHDFGGFQQKINSPDDDRQNLAELQSLNIKKVHSSTYLKDPQNEALREGKKAEILKKK